MEGYGGAVEVREIFHSFLCRINFGGHFVTLNHRTILTPQSGHVDPLHLLHGIDASWLVINHSGKFGIGALLPLGHFQKLVIEGAAYGAVVAVFEYDLFVTMINQRYAIQIYGFKSVDLEEKRGEIEKHPA